MAARDILMTRLVTCFAIGLAACPPAFGAGPIRDSQELAMQSLAETFAKSVATQGRAVGVTVGITHRGRHYLFAYGLADAKGAPAATDSIYEMGSVTKIFTTAMLGQNVAAGTNSLSQTLGDYEAQLGIGRLDPATRAVTLQDLGDFTAGLPSTPSPCRIAPPPSCGLSARAPQPACIPNDRPTIEQYSALDFASYFQWYKAPATPAPYCYSDISTGLIGLLLAAPPNVPLPTDALDRWYSLLRSRIIDPLGLADTFLNVENATPEQAPRLSIGYTATEAAATVSSHAVQQITVQAPGGRYSTAPAVTIAGGGGMGARAVAKLDSDGFVESISVVDKGQDYEAPAEVIFTGGSPTTPAKGVAVVSNGRVTGISIGGPGAGYQDTDHVTVALSGGGLQVQPAKLGPAVISNGAVVFVEVQDGGQGYVDPIAVLVDLPEPLAPNVVPIWGAAGSLKSTVGDMLKLADVALGRLGDDAYEEKLWLWRGLQIAMRPYACGQSTACAPFSGLAWEIAPASNGVPSIITKNGGLSGFSTEFRIVPERDLAVIVFVNSRPNFTEGKPAPTSALIADNILFAILEMDR